MTRSRRPMSVTVRVLSVLALLLLSFAHQPVFARQITPDVAAAYVLPDGSIGEICFGTDGVKDHGAPTGELASICDYCRLAASILLPEPGDAYLIGRVALNITTDAEFRFVFIDYPRTLPQSRAPPRLG